MSTVITRGLTFRIQARHSLELPWSRGVAVGEDLVDWARETVVQFNDEAGWLQWRIVPESEEE